MHLIVFKTLTLTPLHPAAPAPKARREPVPRHQNRPTLSKRAHRALALTADRSALWSAIFSGIVIHVTDNFYLTIIAGLPLL
jgi:hypothetical protein